MTARWETEFWSLLSPDTARRLKIELGIGSDTTDANSAPPAIGTLICLRRNTDIMGVVQPPGHYTRPGEVCIKWDDRDDLYNIQATEIEAV